MPNPPPVYYSSGPRYLSVLLSRLRLLHSQLNQDLHRVGLVESPACSCGFTSEITLHYFFHCHQYDQHREVMFETLTELFQSYPNYLQLLQLRSRNVIDILIKGSTQLPVNINQQLFTAVLNYIAASGRFHND